MATELLDIQPRELKFTVEVKKQSSCSIRLRNKSEDHYVAFKVKTTSPKKYCVRPNIGVIKPGETCEFTVTMQAQRSAPSDLQCKDKFLIQSTVVPPNTIEDDITSDTFTRDSGKHIEDKKLRVVYVAAAPSSPVPNHVNGELKQEPHLETSAQKDKLPSGVENIPPPPPPKATEDVGGVETVNIIDESGAPKDMDKSIATKDLEGFENAEDMSESRATKHTEVFENAKSVDYERSIVNKDVLKVVQDLDELRAKNVNSGSPEDVEKVKPGLDMEKLKLTHDLEVLKSKHSVMDTKLREAELTIKKLREERSLATREKDKFKHELEILRKGNARKVQVGFPILYVVMVALISSVVGYLVHS